MQEIYFETYGCTANYNSTEIMKGLVQQAGLNITQDEKFADLIIINSCIVKEPTEEKIRRKVSDLLKKKNKIILAGCMPRINRQKLQEPNLYLLDTSHVKDITKLIQDIESNQYDEDKYLKPRREVKLQQPKVAKEKTIGITQISEGCQGQCTYCIVRLAKGDLFSYPQEEIIESIKQDLNSGAKEIYITSQDCAAYNNDNGKHSLPKLLKEILKIKKKFFLRVGMMNPNNVLPILKPLIEVYKDPKMYKFLHIPIQSGSDKILEEMKRKYKSKEILEIVKAFRKEFPDIHISTDIIAGYPEETEEDWKQTLEIFHEMQPETINPSRFYPRQKTPASRLRQLPPEIITARTTQLSKLHKQMCNENQKKFLNIEHEVLVNSKGFENTYMARDKNYRLFAVQSRDKNILGKKVKVKVKMVSSHYLISEVVD